MYAEDQNSQEVFDRFKHIPNNNTAAATCIEEAMESSLRTRSMIESFNTTHSQSMMGHMEDKR